MFIFKPTGEVSLHTQSSPVRPVEELERRAVFKQSLWHIVQNAARLGDADAFKRADRLWRERIIDDPSQPPSRNFDELKMLAKEGQADIAMQFARAAPSLGERLFALLKVAEGIAGVSEPNDDPFSP